MSVGEPVVRDPLGGHLLEEPLINSPQGTANADTEGVGIYTDGQQPAQDDQGSSEVALLSELVRVSANLIMRSQRR